MISKQDTQKRMLASKQLSPKNHKLVSLTNIANRSPTAKFDNKEAITNNTLSSKKHLIQNKQKITPTIGDNNSPRNSARASEAEMVKKNSYKQKEENNKNAINAEYNNIKNQNSVPARVQLAPKVFQPQNTIETGQKEYTIINITLPNGDTYKGGFLAGKFHGEGEYFFRDYNFMYKGVFKSGKQHNHGVLINLGTGQIVYEGGWDNGLKHGKGNYVYSPDEYYNGDWKHQQKQGTGFFAFKDGNYSGEWVKNKASGNGNLKFLNARKQMGYEEKDSRAALIQFKGRFQNNEFIQGIIKYANGDEYFGFLKNNLRNGEQCTYHSFSTQMKYKGGYLNDKKHGKGTLTFANGDQLTGTFIDGFLNQNEVVTYIWKDGTKFQGWFKDGKPHKGIIIYPDGTRRQI